MTRQTIEWGARVALPDGSVTVEEFATLAIATNSAVAINQRTGTRPGLFSRMRPARRATVVYRTVSYGDWTTDGGGGEWGVRETWTDGHVETRARRDRNDAEFCAGISKTGSTRVVVSRTKQVSDWQPVGISA